MSEVESNPVEEALKDSALSFNDVISRCQSDMQAVDQVIHFRLSSEVTLVNQLSHYIVNSCGKRLRPLITMLAAKVFSYQGDKHYLMAAIIEFIHTATLLHDDVVDEADLRRGNETAKIGRAAGRERGASPV